MTKILGKSVATAKQMSEYLLSVNKTPKFSRNISVVDFCQLFLDVCAKEGVRGDLAFCQSCKETGNFNFKGDVKYTQNNFAGLGATGGGVPGCVFSSIEEGILAQAQHLKTYATKAALNEPCVDPRRTNWFVNTKGGTAQNWEDLGGTWAVPGYDTKKYSSLEAANKAKDSYGYQIINILNKILTYDKKEETNMANTNSPLVTYTKISPNKTSPRNHAIDTITIHAYVGQVTAERGCNGSRFVNYNPVSGASCNYVVGYDGSIGLCVDEKDRSWCTSNKPNDHRAVTIEVACDTAHPYTVTDKALNALIKLCADICKRNNIKKLVWSTNKNERVNHLNGCNMTVHRDYKNKACPGEYLYERHGYIAEEVNKLLGVKTPASAPTRSYLMKGDKGNDVKVMQENLNYVGYSCGTPDGDFGSKTETALKKFQKAYKLTVDGKYGTSSKAKLEEAVAQKKTSSNKKPSTVTGDFNLIFNATYYSNRYSDLKAAFGTNATALRKHFEEYGMKEGRQAISTFNVKAYKANNADLQKAFGDDYVKYFQHYLTYGYKENRKTV